MTIYSELWLAILAVAALIYAIGVYRRSDYSTWESTLYLPAYLLGRLLWRVRFTNLPPEEIRGGAILAANHRSSLDPMFVQLAARRRVHWMVAKEYCQHPAFGLILKSLEVIPTNRSGTDITSTKIAINYAKQGKLVGLFPEGRINGTTQPLLSVRAGAAMIAAKAGVPIIPMYIDGSPYRGSVLSPLMMPANVHIIFGPAVHPAISLRPRANDSTDAVEQPPARNNEQAVELIQRWAQSMATLAGQPNFAVQVGSSRKQRTSFEES